jgi:hypothetical protein
MGGFYLKSRPCFFSYFKQLNIAYIIIDIKFDINFFRTLHAAKRRSPAGFERANVN